MKLAIDSAQTSGSIALHDGTKLLYSAYFDIRVTHSETLMPAIDAALRLCGIKPVDLQEIYVCEGPGSFTGLRIGVATAKGIAYAGQLPVITHNSLEMLALSCTSAHKNILCVIDAKMNECYAALYDPDLRVIIPPKVLGLKDILVLPISGSIVCGSAANALMPYAEEIGLHFAPALLNIPRAENLIYLEDYHPGKRYEGKLLADLEPNYLRESTAQIKAAARQKP